MSIDFSVEEVVIIFKKLDLNKAHGQGRQVRIRILNLSGDSVNKPLAAIFKNCFNKKIFSNDWKKANVVPIPKNDEEILTNYRLVALHPICIKKYKVLFTIQCINV